MAAALYLHAMVGVTERDLSVFFSRSLGSKWFRWTAGNPDPFGNPYPSGTEWTAVTNSPHVWIGEASWLKGALSGDADTYVPGAVAKIQALIGEELPLLTEALHLEILAALRLPNSTSYAVAKEQEVDKFLREHYNERLFTVSW